MILLAMFRDSESQHAMRCSGQNDQLISDGEHLQRDFQSISDAFLAHKLAAGCATVGLHTSTQMSVSEVKLNDSVRPLVIRCKPHSAEVLALYGNGCAVSAALLIPS